MMTVRFFSHAALAAAAIAGIAWWAWPAPQPPVSPATESRVAPAARSVLASPLAFSAPAASGRSGNGLFALGPQGELLSDSRTADQLDALAQSLPRDLNDDELLALDEFAAAGLQEPEAGEARRIVRDYLARHGIGIAAVAPPPVTPVPEMLPDALLALRPPQPEGDGVLRFPGMGDESN
jgi:hypothetical protein